MKQLIILWAFILFYTSTLFAQVQIDKPVQLTGTGTNAKVTGIQEVINNPDAANKIYVDTAIANRAGGSANCITLSTQVSPAGYYYTGYKQEFSSSSFWYTAKDGYINPRKYPRSVPYNNEVYVFGHAIVSGSSTDNYLSYKFNPTTNTWVSIATMPNTTNYDRYTVEEVGGKIYLLAGIQSSSCGNNNVFEYNPATNTYTQKTDIPSSHYQHASAVYNNKIYVFGGQGNCCGGCQTSDVYEYTPATDTWVQKNNMPFSSYGLIAETVGTKIYVMGGAQSSSQYSTTVYEYDPANDTYTAKASMPTGRRDMASAVYNNKIYVFGGSSNAQNEVNKLEIYNPATNSWTQGENLPVGRSQMGASTINNKVYITGGSFGNSAYDTNWEYNPAQDTGPIFYMHCKQ